MSKTEHSTPRIGIDIGRVIMAPVKNGRADTSFLDGSFERAMETPPSEGAFAAVRDIVDAFDGEAWLVSKCGKTVQSKTRRWLDHWDFYGETGLKRENLRFCLKRPEKAIHCRQLKLTYFIDDRLDVLTHLRADVPNLYLFGEQKTDEFPDWLVHVADWATTRAQILCDLQDDSPD